jgi:hypothetical protein
VLSQLDNVRAQTLASALRVLSVLPRTPSSKHSKAEQSRQNLNSHLNQDKPKGVRWIRYVAVFGGRLDRSPRAVFSLILDLLLSLAI